jgi:hypothetical protein
LGAEQFAGAIDSLYADWLVHGDAAIEQVGRPDMAPSESAAGRLLVRNLPFTYPQFGAWPGVA